TVLRRMLPAGALATAGDTVVLAPEAVEVDALQVRALLTAGALAEAVELYRGELLAGFHPGAPAFEEWLRGERAQLQQAVLQALTALLAAQRAAGDGAAAIATAMRLLALDPLR